MRDEKTQNPKPITQACGYAALVSFVSQHSYLNAQVGVNCRHSLSIPRSSGGIRPFPSIGQLLNGSRFRHCLKGLQGIQNDPPLAAHVAGFAKHAAPRKPDEQCPRRFDAGHPVRRVSHGDGRYTGFLHHPLNQTHGLMTLGSDGHKEKDVNGLGSYPHNELGNRIIDQGCDIVDIAETVIRFRQPADDLFLFQLD